MTNLASGSIRCQIAACQHSQAQLGHPLHCRAQHSSSPSGWAAQAADQQDNMRTCHVAANAAGAVRVHVAGEAQPGGLSADRPVC